MQQIAFAFGRSGDTTKAADLYALSYGLFEELKVSLDEGRAAVQFPADKVRRFAAVSKYQEGVCALAAGDTIHATHCVQLAAFTDEAFQQYLSSYFFEITGRVFDTVLVFEGSSPFLKPAQ